MDIRAILQEAMAEGRIVRVYREELEPGWVDAYVAGMGDEFFALEIFDKAARLDGYNCLRYRDVNQVKSPAPYAEFRERALAARGITRAECFDIDLADLTSILRTAGEAFPLLTIHHEEDDPGVCFIGRLVAITQEEVRLLEVTPDGCFRSEPHSHPLKGMTRVDFGGAYEQALYLVAGAT